MADIPSKGPAGGTPPHEPNDHHGDHSDVRYEASQVSLLRIALVLLAIAATFALAGFVSNVLVRVRTNPPPDTKPDRASYNRPSGALPPDPRLEFLGSSDGHLPEDVFARQLQMERILHSYGTTAEDGFVHIPIREAIRIAAQTLPATKEVPATLQQSFGLVSGGESSSGRNFQEAPSWLKAAR